MVVVGCGVAALHLPRSPEIPTAGRMKTIVIIHQPQHQQIQKYIKRIKTLFIIFISFYFIFVCNETRTHPNGCVEKEGAEVGFLCKQVEIGRTRDRESFELKQRKHEEGEQQRETDAANASHVM